MESRFFAAYAGPSMYPTLREPELLELLACEDRALRPGDVAFFVPPGSDQPIVHRVARVTPAGLTTRGDDNSRDDAWLVPPRHVRGLVVAAWRDGARRTIAGGFRGRLAVRWLRGRRLLDRAVSPLLRLPYRFLSRRGWLARLLPVRLRPRAVAFRADGREQLLLLLGKRLVGRYDDRRGEWLIRRPYRVFVNGPHRR
jgi:hypothetical protein